ncbi:DUF2169 family type VI secretion system accessory protein [Variovorax paradoxus]|uniref:DUF2169 domain-containing protein n=1 Tax=Variovorax paradoxus TaxID=34073 RepID=A0A6I6HD49_VARPD|nr:DUF2169 domain-containing protein [Variovorax paradoxus]QGW80594.1 DUF2169 domain-containing protein [Variovorax paradoxus]
MWQLDNRTPYAAERTWVRDRDGAEIWLVAVKCSFDISPDGETSVAAKQPPVAQVPVFIDEASPQPSLLYEMDLVRTKLTTDVVLIGRAHAPGGVPVTQLDVGLRVGPIAKRLRVTGDRVWLGGVPSEPEAFTAMPLVWERAYGGVDPWTRDAPLPQFDVRNPVGTGFVTEAAHAEGVRLPNIEYPDQCVRACSDRPEPAGFGPLCNHWQPRAGFAGTYDEAWQRDRLPLLPVDFDDRHYQCAPGDQQAPQFLVGDEPVLMVHLAPQPEIRFTLPRVLLGLETFFSDGTQVLHERPQLHTVILEPAAMRVSLVWHSALPCHPKVHKLLKTRIVEKRLLRLGETASEQAVEA